MPPDPPRRVVVFGPNLIGDTVMATPALRALRAGWPDARIDAVFRPHVAPTLDGAPWIDEIIPFHQRSKDRSQRSAALVHRLRRGCYDLAILFPNSFRSALLARLGGVRRRIGYARGGRAFLLSEALTPLRDRRGALVPTPVVEYYLAIVRRLGLPVGSVHTELFTTEADEHAADAAWRRLGLDDSRPVVCLNTGGAFGPAKSWPAESFATLAGRLADEAGASVLVLCGPAERSAALDIVERARHPRVLSLAGESPSLGLSKASVRRCALLVTTDSGPRHFAAAFGVPVVSLFGPTHIAWTRTYHPLAIHLQQPVPCGPCQKGVCPLGHHRCMRELDPSAVFAASLRLLAARRGPTPCPVVTPSGVLS